MAGRRRYPICASCRSRRSESGITDPGRRAGRLPSVSSPALSIAWAAIQIRWLCQQHNVALVRPADRMGNKRLAINLSETESSVEPHCALVLLKADQAQPRESIRYCLLLGDREKACADGAAAMLRINGNAGDEKAAIVAKLNERSKGRVGAYVIGPVSFFHRKRVQHTDGRVREFGNEAVFIRARDTLARAPAGTGLEKALTGLRHPAPDVLGETLRGHQEQSGDLEAVLVPGRSNKQRIAW